MQVLDAPTARYWKISPGENAWQWDECCAQGFIAIGWDELGDISGLNREEFDIRCAHVIEQYPKQNYKKSGMKQVWEFAQIKEGDRVVANCGIYRVLGIGTVVGSYYYQKDAEVYRHRLPIKWDDLNIRPVNQSSWRRTLISLTSEEFSKILRTPSYPGEEFEKFQELQEIESNLLDLQVDSNCPFNLITFELLSKLHAEPRKVIYEEYKQEFKDYLEEPFQQLMQSVAEQLPPQLKKLMETRKRVFARILKNDWGQGGAWDFYWGAFYPTGGKRVEDAQLFLWMNYERLECGFYIGKYGSQQRQRFFENCRIYKEELVSLLQDTFSNEKLVFGVREETYFQPGDITDKQKNIKFDNWLQNLSDEEVRAAMILSKPQVLSGSEQDLIVLISQIYQQVFPLVILATYDEPMPYIMEYLELAEGDSISQINPSFTLHDCAKRTYLDESLLADWINAIERKGQAILYGPPGTGKTYVAHYVANYLISEGDGFFDLVQFHPAYTYEDFIQGIRPRQGKSGLEYPVVPGRFLEFCDEARTREGICVLIIDEINRANLSQVFGELMYLLEYRDKTANLASGTSFSIPKNVRIISTMNTADRSIALVDHALRRRFAFLPLYPNYDGLQKYHVETGFNVDGVIQVLKQVNQAIGDRQYEVGTSFFLRESIESELKSIWQMEIEPYLEEYFFDRPEQVASFRWDALRDQLLP